LFERQSLYAHIPWGSARFLLLFFTFFYATTGFTQAKTETGIHTIASHTSYLINPASPEKKKHAMSCHALKEELVRSSRLDIPFVVLHPGSHMGKGEEYGIDRIVESIKEIIDEIPDRRTRILFETTAGQGFSVGHTFEQLASIL
jgi:deoxyribonuclease-4